MYTAALHGGMLVLLVTTVRSLSNKSRIVSSKVFDLFHDVHTNFG